MNPELLPVIVNLINAVKFMLNFYAKSDDKCIF